MDESEGQRRWTARVARYVAQVAADIHRGMIAGFEKLWYG